MTTTEPKPVARDVSHGTALKANSLGFIGVAFFVISAAAPMAAFVGASPVIFSIIGPTVPLVYVLVAVVIGVFAIGYLKMSRQSSAPEGSSPTLPAVWAAMQRPAQPASSS